MLLLSKCVLEIESSAMRFWLPGAVRTALADAGLPAGADRYEAPCDGRGSHLLTFELMEGGADGLLERFAALIDALEAERIAWEVVEYRDGVPYRGQTWVPDRRSAVEFSVVDSDGQRAVGERDLLRMLARTATDDQFGAEVRGVLAVIASDERAMHRAITQRSWL